MKRKISVVFSLMLLSVISLVAFNAYAADDVSDTKVLDSTNTTVSTYYSEYYYNGSKIDPALTVKYNGKKLVKDTDYTVTYSNDVNVGNATATVTGIGEYSGSVKKVYPIVARTSLSNITFSQDYTSVAYSGKEKKPSVTVKYNGKTLTKNTDYTVSYSSNTNVGTAKINIKGKGNFAFSKTLTFKIVPSSVSGLSFSPETNSITLKWNKMSNVTGYQIMVYDYSKNAYKTVKFVSAGTTSYTIKGLSPSTLYKYNIRAYKEIGSTTYYGVYTNALLTRTRSAATTLTSATKSGTSIKATWNTVQGAGYVLIYATKYDFSNAKEIYINDSRTSSYTIKNINKNATYYLKICPYTTLNGQKYFSKKSDYIATAYTKRLATYSSYYVNNANRTNNIVLASKAIDGTIIMPGETFSFNGVVGQRTYAKGYKDAPVFTSGSVANGVGGGICQVASTMFNTALYANVQITQRSQHSQRVTYVPLGRDAAISWGSQDFKWKNTTSYPIQIEITVKNGKITVEFYTCQGAKVPSVDLSVSKSNGTYTLKRYVDGKCNYTTYSKY